MLRIAFLVIVGGALAADVSPSSLRSDASQACDDYNDFVSTWNHYVGLAGAANVCRASCNPLISRCAPCYFPVSEAEDAESDWSSYERSRDRAKASWSKVPSASKSTSDYKAVGAFITSLPSSAPGGLSKASSISCSI